MNIFFNFWNEGVALGGGGKRICELKRCFLFLKQERDMVELVSVGQPVIFQLSAFSLSISFWLSVGKATITFVLRERRQEKLCGIGALRCQR
ncbi:hypothetical protein D917_09042 [Trichinella nativa]|uniref:Uncharacterized protein n=1 Tax=Trichinella nativa TaxID=6335 RepID=A0A1Y3EHH1_9BILA|nr:hypothetical protein D917_09042 [Trichinella nativa]